MNRYALALVLALGTLATPFACAGPEPTASSAPSTAASFLADYDFEVLIGGQSNPDVAVWASSTLPGKLLIGAPVGGAVFVRLSDKKVVPVNPSKIRVVGDRVSVEADAYGTPLTGWSIEEGGAQFVYEGKVVRVGARP